MNAERSTTGGRFPFDFAQAFGSETQARRDGETVVLRIPQDDPELIEWVEPQVFLCLALRSLGEGCGGKLFLYYTTNKSNENMYQIG